MKLSHRVIKYVSAVMCVLTLVLLSTVGIYSLDAADKADKRAALDASQRALMVVGERVAALKSNAFDWSAWNDTYNVALGMHDDYFVVDAPFETLINLDLNVLAVYDASGALVRATGADLETGSPVDYAWTPTLLTTHSILSAVGRTDALGGTVRLPGGQLLLVAASPIMPTAQDKPPAGTLVMGRLLNESEISEISEISQLKLSMGAVGAKRPTATTALVGGTVDVRTPLLGIGGEPVATLLTEMPRSSYNGALRSSAYVVFCIGLIVLASVLVIYRGLDRIIIRRVTALAKAVERIRQSGEPEPLLDEDDDELAALSEDIAHMVEALDNTRREIAAARDASDSHYRVLINNLAEAVFIVDRVGVIQFVSPGVSAILGHEPASLVGREFRSLFDTDSGDLIEGRIARGMPPAGAQLSLKVRTHEDFLIDAEVALTPFDEDSGDIQAILRDVTARRRYENELLHIASHDFLTGLANRRRFEEEMGRELALANRRASHGAVLWLDLDNFKEVNDLLGHGAGDDMLVRVAERLAASTRAESVLARLGGDEFAVLLPGADVEEAEGAAARLLGEVKEVSLHVDGKMTRASVSIGIVFYPEHGTKVDELLSRADMAMYRAKEMGRSRFKVFEASERWRDEIEDRRTWIELVELALAQDGLRVFAQPISDTLTGRTDSYELLVRMTDLNGAIIPPDRFLPVAERVGLIVDIDLWMLRKAAQILAHSHDDFKLNVNVSTRTLSEPRFLRELESIVTESDIDPGRLVIEITETAVLVDVARVQDTLRTIKSLGCRITLDDFGSGFTSFLHLKQLPIDDIKIDGSFIQNLCDSPNDQHLVRAMVEMARGLGRRTTAEFVESSEALDLLRVLGVEMVQGYHIAKPGPAETVIVAEDVPSFLLA